MKEEQFHIESNSPLLFTIKTSSEKIYKVLISDDLFESHTCTCPVYKAKGMCHHIEAV